jgi:hypothetical protein
MAKLDEILADIKSRYGAVSLDDEPRQTDSEGRGYATVSPAGVCYKLHVTTRQEIVRVKRKGYDAEEVRLHDDLCLTIYANGNIATLAHDEDSLDVVREAIDAALKPLPSDAITDKALPGFTAIGFVRVDGDPERTQLARVNVLDGKVVSMTPLFKHEPERTAFALCRLESTFIALISQQMSDGVWETNGEAVDG